jgi:AcrR family transcriptional regulator
MGSKQDLLLTLMRDAMHEMVANAQAALADADDPPTQLAGLARAHVTYNGEHLLDAYVGDAEIRSLDPANRARIVKIRDTYEQLWADVIARGVEHGDFQVADPKIFRISVIQMCNGVTYWYSPAGPTPLSVIADQLAHYTLAMAGFPGAPEAFSEPASPVTQKE